MLTIKPPIQLKTQKSLTALHPDMEEKVRGNYTLMNPGIRAEELLHVASASPEIYFAEGSSISVLNQIQNENQQEIRLDVINNLMNRILISGTENFRYQDTVYVSSILRKLGIRNVNNFMRQVQQLQEERREDNRVLHLYEDNRKLLAQVLSGEQEKTVTGEKPEKEEQQEKVRPEYFLQEDIYRRLETSRIYQDMRDFSRGITDDSSHIFRTEMNMAEQTSLIQNFQLNEVKKDIYQQEIPLYYYHVNEYELADGGEEGTLPEEKLSAALLLNLTDYAYALRQEQVTANSHHWYSVAGALFETAENTWKRFENWHQEERGGDLRFAETRIQLQEERRMEEQTLTQLTEELQESRNQWQETYRDETNIRNDYRYNQETNRQETQISGGSYHVTAEELNLTYLEQQEGEEEQTPGTKLTTEQIQKQLEVLNQKNIENLRKLNEIKEKQPGITRVTVDREKARKDALRALTNPEEVLREVLTSETRDRREVIRNQMEDEIYNLFSDETKEIYRQYVEQKNGGIPMPMTYAESQNIQPEAAEAAEAVGIRRTQEESRQTEREQAGQLSAPSVFRESIRTSETTDRRETVKERYERELQELLREKAGGLYTGEQDGQRKSQPMELIYEPVTASQPEETEGTAETDLRQSGQQPETIQEERIREESRLVTERIVRPEIRYQINEQMKQKLVHLREQNTTKLYEKLVVPAEQRAKERAAGTVEVVQKGQPEPVELVLAERLRERSREPEPPEAAVRSAERLRKSLQLVHKEEEQVLTEELLETIRQQTNTTVRQEETQERTVQKNSVTETTVQNAVNHIRTEQLTNVDELIERNVRKQIGNLSDQVYSRIEKKLQTERKRRGM